MAGAVLFKHLQYSALDGRLQSGATGRRLANRRKAAIPLRSMACLAAASAAGVFYRQIFM
ncbi:MAG: hypothetical protein ORN83_09735 [Chthoniobacteraceae bacterium]|nr:hypothetical protein [Chthoniobacteraceae bacterium]